MDTSQPPISNTKQSTNCELPLSYAKYQGFLDFAEGHQSSDINTESKHNASAWYPVYSQHARSHRWRREPVLDQLVHKHNGKDEREHPPKPLIRKPAHQDRHPVVFRLRLRDQTRQGPRQHSAVPSQEPTRAERHRMEIMSNDEHPVQRDGHHERSGGV